MRTPLTALREHRRAVADKKADRQAHLERGIRWLVADYWGSVAHAADWDTVLAMYSLAPCPQCGIPRLCHHGDGKKHLRLHGGTG